MSVGFDLVCILLVKAYYLLTLNSEIVSCCLHTIPKMSRYTQENRFYHEQHLYENRYSQLKTKI